MRLALLACGTTKSNHIWTKEDTTVANHPAIKEMMETLLAAQVHAAQLDMIEMELARQLGALARITGNPYAAQFVRDLADGLMNTATPAEKS